MSLLKTTLSERGQSQRPWNLWFRSQETSRKGNSVKTKWIRSCQGLRQRKREVLTRVSPSEWWKCSRITQYETYITTCEHSNNHWNAQFKRVAFHGMWILSPLFKISCNWEKRMYHQTPPTLYTISGSLRWWTSSSGNNLLLCPESHSNIHVLLLGILTQRNYVKDIIQYKRKPNIQRYSVRYLQVKQPCSSKNSKQIMT